MEEKVLIIDRDRYLIQAVDNNIKRLRPVFRALYAPDGMTALRLLKSEPVALVLCNLKLLRASEISFLRPVFQSYLDIGLIIIPGAHRNELQNLGNANGRVHCIEEPYTIEGIVTTVQHALEQQADAGILYDVSVGVFLQLIEVEQRTCTIRLMDQSTKKTGALFFREGTLLDARLNDLKGEDAAYEILSWDKVSLRIQNSCWANKRKIRRELQAIMLEAMKRKDEAAALNEAQEEHVVEAEIILPAEEKAPSEIIERVRKLMQSETTYFEDVVGIRQDTSLDSLLVQTSRIGAFFRAGNLKAVYLDRGDKNDYLVIPEEHTVVVEVDRKCSRDRFIKLLLERG